MAKLSHLADDLQSVEAELHVYSRNAEAQGLNHLAVSLLAIAGEVEGWSRYCRYCVSERSSARPSSNGATVHELPF
jgi:hypothetical protein